MEFSTDLYSYSNPHQVLIKHIDLDWDISFDSQTIKGEVTLHLDKTDNSENFPLILDSRDLTISKVQSSRDNQHFVTTDYVLGLKDDVKGQSISINLPLVSNYVKISYQTNPNSQGLQWLKPNQTTDGNKPMMFSVACPIHARDFMPVQDSPQLRITYTANIHTRADLLVLMGADGNPTSKNSLGYYNFVMDKPIPPYLISIAVGDFEFKKLSDETGIYAENSLLNKAAAEFSDINKMMKAAKHLYGEYLWGRYDMLILPNSFPASAMENPLLTFFSASLIVGDKSLVSVIAHELAHSWSGNLITNASWNDVWLNEGITTYIQNRIVEEVYGSNQAEIETKIAYDNLLKYLKYAQVENKILDQNFRSPHPDRVFSPVPYIKGFLFIRYLEQILGRNQIDDFLRSYIKDYSFKSISTMQFKQYLFKYFPSLEKDVIYQWLSGANFPDDFKEPESLALNKIHLQANKWMNDEILLEEVDNDNWRGQQWLYFLNVLPEILPEIKLQFLKDFVLKSNNPALIGKWLVIAIKNNYEVDSELKNFLANNGKLSLILPIYQELAKTIIGKDQAVKLYQKSKAYYHAFSRCEVEKLLGLHNLTT